MNLVFALRAVCILPWEKIYNHREYYSCTQDLYNNINVVVKRCFSLLGITGYTILNSVIPDPTVFESTLQ